MEFQNKNIFNLLEEDDNISVASSNDSKNSKIIEKTEQVKLETKPANKKVFHHKKSLLNTVISSDQTKQQNTRENTRENALNILSNKETLNKELAKTKLCNSVSEGKTCPYKEKCRFAHTVDELVIKECLFGERCIYVFRKNSIWNNKSGKKVCFHRHTNESNDNYLIRTGLKEGDINNCVNENTQKTSKPVNERVNERVNEHKYTKKDKNQNKILHVSPHIVPAPPLDFISDEVLLPPPVIGISTFYSPQVCATTIFPPDYGKKLGSDVFPESITITIKNDEELYIKLEEALENGYRDINIKVVN